MSVLCSLWIPLLTACYWAKSTHKCIVWLLCPPHLRESTAPTYLVQNSIRKVQKVTLLYATSTALFKLNLCALIMTVFPLNYTSLFVMSIYKFCITQHLVIYTFLCISSSKKDCFPMPFLVLLQRPLLMRMC